MYAHNVETVERLQSTVRDRRANWSQSIRTLQMAKARVESRGGGIAAFSPT